MRLYSAKDLDVYKKSYRLAMRIFQISCDFPFAKDCSYISTAEHDELTALSKEIGKMLGTMIKAPGSFLTSGLSSPTSDAGILLL